MNIDLLSGAIDFAFAHVTSIVPQIKSGNVRPLAATSKVRSSLLPDVPTMSEVGIRDFEAGELHGLLAPKGTPKEIVARLNKEILAVMKRPDVRQKVVDGQGAQMVESTPAQFAEFIKVESARWGKVARDAGLTPTGG
jgi:tripartite-type tricarboxylate transporter receptor subunit TctC